jgi:glycosyltransferase involved in cell wall biosynthesis
MKVACISASQIPSSTANSMQVMKACQAIQQLEHDVHLFVPAHNHQSEIVDLISYYGLKTSFKIEWLPSRQSLHRYDFVFQAVRSARRLRADICYVWPIQAGIFSLMSGLPVIIELHGPPEGRFGPTIFHFFQQFPGKKRMLPITHALAEQLHDRFRIDTNNKNLINISPNGVDLDRYNDLPDPSAARKLLKLPDLLTVGYTGHLYPGRGMTLLENLAIRFPYINFLWVGGQSADVTTWRDRLSAQKIGNVIMTGFVQNCQLPLYQAASDILLMPYENVITGSSGGNSTSYASPMKMFEYMASRRVIISSDLPVIREVLTTTNSMLCPPEDINAWSQAIESLISDIEKRNVLAQQAWLDVQQYTWLNRARNALEGFVI